MPSILVEYRTSRIAQYRPPSSTTPSIASKREISSVTPRKTISSRNNTHKQRKAPKSAPPARTQSLRVASKPRPKDGFSISLDDIYQSAERERLSYSAACRRQNLEHAQSQTQFFRHENNALPLSRPNTSGSMILSRRDIATPMSAWSEPQISRPSSLMRHSGMTGLNDLDEDEEHHIDELDDMERHSPLTISPISKDCCEIIGPQMCQECRKNRIRQMERNRSNNLFPTLQPTDENLTTAAIVKKYLPGLSYPEIEDKIARGEIAKPTMRRRSKSVEFSDEEDDPKHRIINTRKVTIVDNYDGDGDEKKQPVLTKKTSALFFSNIRDLNSKIIAGAVDRNIGFTVSKKTEKKLVAAAQNFFPSFISPRKTSLIQDTKFKTYYEPPLIPKASQDVEPQFFAGSKGEYVPPERLPEELVFVDKEGKQVKISNTRRLSSQLSLYRDSPITEEATEETPDVFKEGVKEVAPTPETIHEENEEEHHHKDIVKDAGANTG